MTGPQPHQNAGPSNSAAWAHAVNMLLGLWLIAAPPTFGVSTPALIWSDVVSGALVVALSALALRRSWAAWAACGVGLWLMGAPLLFWARSAAVYNDDTLIGALVVTFAVIVPRFGRDDAGGMPPGWSYNPSAWAQRVPIAFLAMLGFFLSRYMAAFQLGHIAYPWDPFFGDGTRTVLTSDIARSFPVSDAGLGALSYLLDALAGVLGDQRRWRTMPWMVVLFGFFIIPPGVTSIVLVILQPVAVGTWCTLCLVGAVITLVLVPPALDEVVATGQFLLRTRREGRSLWRAFWQGEGSTQEAVQPARPSSGFGELLHGIEIFSAPWNLLASALVGVWLMAAPSLLETSGAAANNEYIMGALVATFAVVAIAEPARVVRLLNVACGLWLIAAPWLLAGGTPASRWSDVIVGFVLIVLSLRRGRLEDRYGGWERWIV